MFREKIIAAGFGGQGALRIGQMLAYAALDSGWEAAWLPSYGAEMRGGAANCHVTISDGEIPFPAVTEADCCIVMNDLSLEKFGDTVRPGGALILNRSIIAAEVTRRDVRTYCVPADAIAEEEGNTRGANMVMLGAYIAVSERLSPESIYAVIDRSFTGSKAKYADANKRLVKRGMDCVQQSAVDPATALRQPQMRS
jgi:2-oxoglutarate ferredoxin oxidoreductase subunit gamma